MSLFALIRKRKVHCILLVLLILTILLFSAVEGRGGRGGRSSSSSRSSSRSSSSRISSSTIRRGSSYISYQTYFRGVGVYYYNYSSNYAPLPRGTIIIISIASSIIGIAIIFAITRIIMKSCNNNVEDDLNKSADDTLEDSHYDV